jgi:cell division protein FtsW (lipid II flippase)
MRPRLGLAVLEGKVSSRKICSIFGVLGGLTILGILFTIVYEFCYLGARARASKNLLCISFCLASHVLH